MEMSSYSANNVVIFYFAGNYGERNTSQKLRVTRVHHVDIFSIILYDIILF